MLPGTKYTPEDILRILRRRIWLIVVPVAIASAAAYYYAASLPNLFRSESVLLLMPQRISEGYVKSALNVKVTDRLTTLKEQVLSRPNLEQLILDYNLYQAERQAHVSMDRLVQRMTKEVTADAEGTGSVRLTYTSASPATAQQVTARVAELFIEENQHDRENVADVTNSFLDSQLIEAKTRLLEQEKKLEEYRKRYGNELPTQAASNLQAIQGLEGRLRTVSEVADRSRQSRLTLERQLADLQSQDPGLLPATASGDNAAQKLENAKADLAKLQMRLKPDHPSVREKVREIRDLEQQAEVEAKAPARVAAKSDVSLTEVNRQKKMRELETSMSDIDGDLKTNADQQQQIRAEISGIQARLNALPTRESELVELTRDYQTVLNQYHNLSAKREESTISANLERKNVGEQFRVLEQAGLPDRPSSPDRQQIQLVGTAVGLILGLVLIGYLEYRDTSFKTEEDVFRVLSLPVLATIPILATAADAGRRKKRAFTFFSSASGLFFVGVAVVAWFWRQS